MYNLHQPVLLSAVVDFLARPSCAVLVDGTVGTGGHAEALCQTLPPASRLICLDQDPDCVEQARLRLSRFGSRVSFHRCSFSALDTVLAAEGVAGFDGILLDLGLNTWTLSQPEKGLSYLVDGPLRMNVDPDLGQSAAQFLASADESELVRIFTLYGGVRRPRVYARRVLAARERQPLRTTFDLGRAFSGRKPGDPGSAELSRLFQALRVEVCHEMDRLERFLEHAGEWIHPGGRLAILTYAGHEARRVKEWSRRSAAEFTEIHRGGIGPSPSEVRANRRARSARMRMFERKGEG